MDVLKKGKSEIDKSEGDSERVEDGRASTKVSNGDGEQETGEEEHAATQACTDGVHRIGQDELDAGSEESEEGDDEAQEDGEKQPKRRYNRSFSTVLGRVVIYSFSCTLFFRIINR
jgi:cobalamin biosynthesis protein CobT